MPDCQTRPAGMTPLADRLAVVTQCRMPESGGEGWGVRMRRVADYYTPDEMYEAALVEFVRPETDWLDVGCGWRLLPQNPRLAQLLAARARHVAGVDPDPSIRRNPLLAEAHQCRLEDLRTDRRYNLVTLRMVAEHIADPGAAVASLTRLTAPGGWVVIYTVHRWAPVSVAAAATPLWAHRMAKRLLWRDDPSDSFPTLFKMNTRGTLRRLFEAHGFVEQSYELLDDCRMLQRWQVGLTAELWLWRALRRIGLRYPEVCILGVYGRNDKL